MFCLRQPQAVYDTGAEMSGRGKVGSSRIDKDTRHEAAPEGRRAGQRPTGQARESERTARGSQGPARHDNTASSLGAQLSRRLSSAPDTQTPRGDGQGAAHRPRHAPNPGDAAPTTGEEEKWATFCACEEIQFLTNVVGTPRSRLHGHGPREPAARINQVCARARACVRAV